MISPDRMYVLALEEVQEEYEKWYAECEELKEKYKWYEHYKDSALYNKDLCNKKSDEIESYKQALNEIEEYCKLGTKGCLTDCPEYAVGQGCSQNCYENRLKVFLDIINKADFGKSETRLGESFDEKVEPPIIQEAKEV